ncbi:MAG: hypothetical protein WD492_14430 [Alkalispirochaeta sp.]
MLSRCLRLLGYVMVVVGIISCGNMESETVFEGEQPGSYVAVSEYPDGTGWAPFVFLRIGENGDVERLVFDYVDTDLRMRSSVTVESNKESDEIAAKLKTAQAFPVNDDTLDQEALGWGNALVQALIPRVTSEDERPVVLPMSAKYSAEDDPDSDGWIAVITVAIDGRSITAIDYDEVRKQGGAIIARKSSSSAYAQEWRAAGGHDPQEVYGALAEQLVAEGAPSGVDVIGGATITSQRFRTLAGEALQQRTPIDFIGLKEHFYQQ